MVGKSRWARVWYKKGWTVDALALYFEVPESEIIRALEYRPLPKPSRAMPPAEKRRRSEQRSRRRAKAIAVAKARLWRGDDWRFRDDAEVNQVEHHGADLRLGGVESNAVTPAIAPELVKPVPSTWRGPSSPCQTSLKGDRRRIKD